MTLEVEYGMPVDLSLLVGMMSEDRILERLALIDFLDVGTLGH